MFLKSLEMQGFKSFPDRIRLEIGQGLTAVVGPNGSGKSNVSDAIRWVLGEQSSKSLRGEKMEDVIFSGTQQRKAMGFAEVSLTIDNRAHAFNMDAEEIKITRKYYRSGESDYLINGQNVRLKDINELFMDTGLGRDGYSIIGQGKIQEIVGAKSAERRVIFEEAAGIAKYRYRREQAERKLSQAEDNLVRLRDILTELEDRVGPLKEQSEKATAFVALDGKKRELEISLWVQKLEQLRQQLRGQDNQILTAQSQYEELEALAQKAEEAIDGVYGKKEELLREIDGLQAQKKELEEEKSKIASTVAVLQNDIAHNEQQVQRLKEEAENTKAGDEETARLLEENAAHILHLTQTKAQNATLQQDLEQQLSNLHLQSSDVSDQLTEITAQLNTLAGTLSNAKVLLASFQTTKDEITARLEQVKEELADREQTEERVTKELVEVNRLLAQIQEQQQSDQNEKDGYGEILAMKERKLQEGREQIQRRQAEMEKKQNRAKILADMEKNMEGYAHSVKFVLQKAKAGLLPGIEGAVSQLLHAAPDRQVAIEIALGGALQNIVCRTEADAKQAIAALKQADGGRATFLPVSNIQGHKQDVSAVGQMPGFLGLASQAVQYDTKYENIVQSLLGRIVLADNLNNATAIAKKGGYRFKVVTLDGQVVNAGGSLTGGSSGKNNGLLSRSGEIKRLEQEAAQLQTEITQAEKSLEAPAAEVEKIRARLLALESDMVTLNEDKVKAQTQKDALLREQATLDESIERLEQEQTVGQKRLVSLEETQRQAAQTEQTTTAQMAELEQQSQSLSDSRQGVKEERNRLFEALNTARMDGLALEKDLQTAEENKNTLQLRGADAQARREQLLAEAEALVQKNQEILGQIGQTEEQNAAYDRRVAALDDEMRQKSVARNQLDGDVTQLRQEAKEKADQKDSYSRELVRLEERKNVMQTEHDRLLASLLDEYELTLQQAEEKAQPVEDLQAAQKELASLKGKIRQLGHVNVAAIEEYKEVSQRYEFLSAQVSDVEDSKKELMSLIGDLNKTMEHLFSAEFEKINANFGQIFHNLFGGGTASLAFSDPENLLESGIDIKVQPPGKIINHLSALSGGEQALVAVSIYFAILKVRPAPFCVLDEIDAALDDVNVNKLAAYLNSLGDKTQFISITHKRGTMEAAERLYGVTMQEKGVTKVLSLEVAEAMEKLAEQN